MDIMDIVDIRDTPKIFREPDYPEEREGENNPAQSGYTPQDALAFALFGLHNINGSF